MKNFFKEFVRIFGYVTGYPLNLLFFKKKVFLENKNAEKQITGGALIVSNHFNPLDYVMCAFHFFPRKLYVVAAELGYKNKFVAFWMNVTGGIQANRITKDMSFVIRSIRELKKGHIVQIFPEGHNTDDGTIKAFYPSYIMIALKANVPIVPVVTDGNYGPFKRAHVMIGEKIYLDCPAGSERSKLEMMEKLNDTVRQKMISLKADLDARVERGRAH